MENGPEIEDEIPLALPPTDERGAFGLPASSILAIPLSIYRGYADEFRQLAHLATNDHQRALYWKMVHIWNEAAVQFLDGVDQPKCIGPDGDSAERNQEQDIAFELGRQQLRMKFTPG